MRCLIYRKKEKIFFKDIHVGIWMYFLLPGSLKGDNFIYFLIIMYL